RGAGASPGRAAGCAGLAWDAGRRTGRAPRRSGAADGGSGGRPARARRALSRDRGAARSDRPRDAGLRRAAGRGEREPEAPRRAASLLQLASDGAGACRAARAPASVIGVERARPPAVSVIIPCYNLGAYLDEAVESVLAQTCRDFEIIVVDDGSTEPQTRAVVDAYDRPGTRVIRAEHAGLAAARNTGIATARGNYLCALDADDRLDPTFLEKTARVLDADPSVTFVSSWLRAFGDEEWEWKPERCDLPTLLSENTVLTAA